MDVEYAAALLAAAAAGDALYDFGVIDLEQHHRIERLAEARQQARERPCLGEVAWETVENEAALGIAFGQPFAKNAEHDLIGHQLAGIHGRFGPQTVLGAARDRAAQQVTGRYLGNAKPLDQTLRLGALARPRGPHKHDTHPGNSTHRRLEGQTRELCAHRTVTGRLRGSAQGMLARRRHTGAPRVAE